MPKLKSTFSISLILLVIGFQVQAQVLKESGNAVRLPAENKGPVVKKVNEPFIVVKNGDKLLPITMDLMNGIDPLAIDSMQVYSGQKAIELYGDKAEFGAIVLTLKEEVSNETMEGIRQRSKIQDALSVPRYLAFDDFDAEGNLAPTPTYYGIKSQGKVIPVTYEFAMKLNPVWINTVEVFKSDESVKQFGPVAKKGAILLSIKPEHEAAVLQSIKK